MLEIENLSVSVEGKLVLKGIDLFARGGEIHAVMGPNGSGKTSLAFAIMGHPKYKIESGRIVFEGKYSAEEIADTFSEIILSGIRGKN